MTLALGVMSAKEPTRLGGPGGEFALGGALIINPLGPRNGWDGMAISGAFGGPCGGPDRNICIHPGATIGSSWPCGGEIASGRTPGGGFENESGGGGFVVGVQ